MLPPEIPQSITPLTAATTDMQVLDGAEEPKLLNDTDEAKILLALVQDYDRQEEFVRQTLLRKCRKGIHYWNNFQYLAWDEVAHDWRTAEQILEEDPQADIDPALYAKVVNIYKAHGEILIGALSAGLPTVRFPPKDADDPEDVTASKAHTKIAELIQRHNRAKLLLMKALFILYNQGMVACYNENKADYRFGTIKTPTYEDKPVTDRNSYCPSCGESLGQETMPSQAMAIPTSMPMEPQPAPEDPQAPTGAMGTSEFAPSGDEELAPAAPAAPEMPTQPIQCPSCRQMVEPEFDDQQRTEQVQTGETTEPKNRECLEIYGPINVKIPLWCRDQFSTPYLILETEEHVALMKEIYPELAELIQPTSYPDTYEKEARIPTNYRNDFPRDIVTVQRVWFRPWALNNHPLVEEVKPLKAQHPDGIYVVIINKSLVAEIVSDKLDEHWTLSENPLAETLHPEPIGAPMIPLQDIENETTNLVLETIEFGIPETFADPRTIDFDAYQRQEARPGQISPATAPAGHSLGEGFFSVKASTLSREVSGFQERGTQMAQFVMGSYPSVYGGSQEGGGGTAREYELSRTSALQRLSSTWTIVQEWWAKAISKSVKSFAKNMREDERYVMQKGGSFINVWIRKTELSGDAGELEPEISEAFPISWSQKRDVLLNLMQMKDEDVAAVIRHPENAGLVASIIGVPEMYIPGDDDRTKQLMEIGELIMTEPQMSMPALGVPGGPGQMGAPQEQMGGMPPPEPQFTSTIPITPELDNHQVEAEICKAWLKSEVGQDAKKTNPGGYMNVLAHMKEHLAIVAQQQAEMMAAQAQAQGKEGGGDNLDSKGIQSESASA